MKKQTLAALLALLLLVGCSQSGDSRGTTFEVVPAATYSPIPKQIVVSINYGAPINMQEALGEFCGQIQTLSGGNLVAVTRKTATPLKDFERGLAHLAFLSPEEAAAASPEFKVCSEPFRYRSYEQFAMACNSEPVLEALEDSNESLDARVLAGYYTGSTMLVSRIFLAGKKAYVPPDGTDRAIALTITPETADGLERLEFEVRSEPDLAARARYLSDGTVQVIELTFEELERSGLDYKNFHFVLSENNAAPYWLIASRPMLESLQTSEAAALDEASARLSGRIDAEYADRERLATVFLLENNAEIIKDFSGNRAKITRSEEAADTDPSVTRFRKLLDSLG